MLRRFFPPGINCIGTWIQTRANFNRNISYPCQISKYESPVVQLVTLSPKWPSYLGFLFHVTMTYVYMPSETVVLIPGWVLGCFFLSIPERLMDFASIRPQPCFSKPLPSHSRVIICSVAVLFDNVIKYQIPPQKEIKAAAICSVGMASRRLVSEDHGGCYDVSPPVLCCITLYYSLSSVMTLRV